MSNTSSRSIQKLSPLSIRLSAEERRALEARAGSVSLSAYVKSRLFGATGGAVRAKARRVQMDEAMAGRILAALGRASLVPNLAALAQAVQSGSLSADEETARHLQLACRDVAAMRALLMLALGKKDGTARPSGNHSQLQQVFASAVGQGGAKS